MQPLREVVVAAAAPVERGRWRKIGSPAGPALGLPPSLGIGGLGPRLDPKLALGEDAEAVPQLGFSTEDIALTRAEGEIGEHWQQIRELGMFRSLPKRAVLAWLLGRLGPPPPPPRRHFAKNAQRSSHLTGADPGRAVRYRAGGVRHSGS